MDPQETLPLGRTGVRVTRLALGTAPLGNLFAPVTDADARATVDAAWEAGIRHFDTAPFYGYGLAERRLGEALRSRPRDAYTLSTKVGRRLVPNPRAGERDEGYVDPLPFEPVFDYGYDGVHRSFEEGLERLGTDRADVVLLHDLGSLTHGERHRATFEEAMTGGLRALAELKRDGRARAIGLGVNEQEVCLEAMARAEFDVFLLAGRYTLLDQGALDSFLPECRRRGIDVMLGGPFNSGILAAEATEASGRDTYDYVAAPSDIVERVRALRVVCERHGVPLAAAALRFPLLHPAIPCVLAGARTADEVRSNVRRFRMDVPAALFDALKAERLVRADAPTEAPA